MRYGLLIDTSRPVPDIITEVQKVADAGIQIAGASQIFGYDTLTVLAVVGQQVPDVELMTAVVPTYPRHPFMLAAQALTVQAVAGGSRLTLGIGLSHQLVIENMFGLSFDRPARHMREYLHVLMPLLEGQQAVYQGETLKVAAGPIAVEAARPDVLVAALAPTMLKLAGTLGDGTATWMTGPRTVESHIVPSITAAASEAGRKPPRVSVGVPVCVTADVEAARERAARIYSLYGQLPVYQAVLEREGVDGPADIAVVGDEQTVADQLTALEGIGATEVLTATFGTPEERDKSFALVSELARAGSS
jgi:5,10-methylenetetrahydromethanopterin reductase